MQIKHPFTLSLSKGGVRGSTGSPRTLLLISILLLDFAGCAVPAKPTPILATVASGRLEWAGNLPILHLTGTPYDIGYQHGSLMRPHVRASVENAMAFAKRHTGVPMGGRFLIRRRLAQAWKQMEPHVPERYLEELKGLADGAGLPLKTLHWIHAIPDLTSTSCASFAASGSATEDGRLIHIRNLDWAIKSNVQRYSAIFVVHPKGEHRAFVNIGWLGFIGVISGINQDGISVGEIGSETVDQSLKGVPMPFLLRRVLEESVGLEKATDIIKTGPRTVGYNYLFADAKNRTAVAMETTQKNFALFKMNEEPPAPYGIQVQQAILRSDWALDPHVRDLQIACKGDPDQPGLESPRGASAYEVRYQGQALLLKQFHGRLNPEIAMAIARAIAPGSNMQSIVYAFPELWFAVAEGKRPAAQGVYRSLDLEELFKSS